MCYHIQLGQGTFKKDLFSLFYIIGKYVCLYVYLCTRVYCPQRLEVSEPLQLESYMVVSHLTWCLELSWVLRKTQEQEFLITVPSCPSQSRDKSLQTSCSLAILRGSQYNLPTAGTGPQLCSAASVSSHPLSASACSASPCAPRLGSLPESAESVQQP